MTVFIPNPLAPVIAKLMAKPQVDEAAQQGVQLAQSHAPVETGEMRDSIHVEDAPGGGQRVVVGTDHWIYPEFGTSEQPAQPFMRPIIDELGLHK